ncbi:MAG: hypothetical protein KDA05_10070 [Phycisphaerales bacterium]|nr:hypothetical protein [Phycisphaerales bacterium]
MRVVRAWLDNEELVLAVLGAAIGLVLALSCVAAVIMARASDDPSFDPWPSSTHQRRYGQ